MVRDFAFVVNDLKDRPLEIKLQDNRQLIKWMEIFFKEINLLYKLLDKLNFHKKMINVFHVDEKVIGNAYHIKAIFMSLSKIEVYINVFSNHRGSSISSSSSSSSDSSSSSSSSAPKKKKYKRK